MPVETVYAIDTISTAQPPNVANAYGAPDGLYAGDGNYFDDTVWKVQWDRPLTGPPTTGTHQVTIHLRKNASGGNDPTLAVSASSSKTTTTVGVYSGTVITDGVTSVTFSVTESQVSGLSLFDCLTLTMLRGGGGPSSRRQIEVESIEIDFETSTPETGEWSNTFDGGPEGTDITVANSGTYGQAFTSVTGAGTTSGFEYRAAGAYSGTRGLRHTAQGNSSSLGMAPDYKQPKAAFRFFYRSSDNAGAYTLSASISQREHPSDSDYCSIRIIPGASWSAGPNDNRQTMSGVPLADTWYCVDMFWDGATTTYKARLTEASSGAVLDTLDTTLPNGVGIDNFQIAAPASGGFTADLDEWQVDWDATDLYPALPTGPATHQTTGALSATGALTATTPIDRFNDFDDMQPGGTTISGGNSGSATSDVFTIVSGTVVFDDTVSKEGADSAKSDTNVTGNYNVVGWREAGHGHLSGAVSCWVRWSGATTTGGDAFLSLRDSGDVLVAVLRWSTETGEIDAKGGSGSYSTVTTLAASTSWYRLDLYADWGPGNEVKARVLDDTGQLVAEATPTPNFSGFTDEAWDLRVGNQDPNGSGTIVHFDELHARYGATDYVLPLGGPSTTGALSATGALAADAQVIRAGTGALAATADLTSSGLALRFASGSLAATADLTGTASTSTPPVTFTGALAGSAGLSAQAGVVKSTQASMASVASLAASGALTLQGQATLAATGALTGSATGASTVTLDGALTATGDLQAQASRTQVLGGSLAATGTLQGQATREVALDGSLAASAGLSAQAGVTKSTTGFMAATGLLDASGAVALDAEANLAATGALTASASGAATVTLDGTLAATGALAGDAEVTRAGAASLGAAANLTGSASVTMATSGALAALGTMAAQSGGAKTTTSVQAFSGALSASGLIVKPSTGGSTATGALVAEAQVIRAGTATLAATSLMALQEQRSMVAGAALLATASTIVLATAAPPITIRPTPFSLVVHPTGITPRPTPGLEPEPTGITPRPTP